MINNKKRYKTAIHTTSNVVLPVPLFMPKQVYDIEQRWFDADNDSYSLMQQAAWQIAYWTKHYALSAKTSTISHKDNQVDEVYIWVGAGNNGGDGWLVATYLSQLAMNVTVIEVGEASTNDSQLAKKTAKQAAKSQSNIHIISFSQINESMTKSFGCGAIMIDALFGIGLDRVPMGDYAKAIQGLNDSKQNAQTSIIAIDVPSGLVASTGQVFDGIAVKADVTLCLVARKLGLHIKDGQDHTGEVVDIPLIPTVLETTPTAELHHSAKPIPKRMNNAYKGSFGNVLIVGGNQLKGSQGMGGAAILSASSAFAVGAGKLTVACHEVFHSSLIANVPNAMSIDLHDTHVVKELIEQCDVMAIGMGFGRDEQSQELFYQYLKAGVKAQINMVIDADGLYHLAHLTQKYTELNDELAAYSIDSHICYTPHSGEAARLLDIEVSGVENDRFAAIQKLAQRYHGSWLLKGNGSIVVDGQNTYICDAGNAGMSTAGMGDVLSGVAAGLMAQSMLPKPCRSLQQAVMIHAMAGDKLSMQRGEWALQASDMSHAIGDIMQEITQ